MAKKKPTVNATTDKPASVRHGKAVNAWVDPELYALLQSYLNDLRPSPTVTSVVEVALEDFLRERGYKRKPQA